MSKSCIKTVIFFLLWSVSWLQGCAQHHNGPVNATGQIDKPRKGKLLQKKGHGEFELFNGVRAVDLSPYAPKPMWQPYANCYAYATVYTARTLLYNFEHQVTGSPDSTIFSPGFLQKLIYPNTDACQSNGDDTYSACQYLRDSGIVFRKDYPHDCTTDPITPALLDKAKNYRINPVLLYEQCENADVKIQSIKNSLAQHKPVVIAWLSEASFNGGGYDLECWQPTRGDLRQNACRKGANHAICVIGYDDDKFGGAFYIQNSWRPTWGKGDRMWIKYADMAQFSKYAIEFSSQAP